MSWFKHCVYLWLALDCQDEPEALQKISRFSLDLIGQFSREYSTTFQKKLWVTPIIPQNKQPQAKDLQKWSDLSPKRLFEANSKHPLKAWMLPSRSCPFRLAFAVREASWWLNQLLWKILVKMGIFPNFRGEHQKIFELPPPRRLYPHRNRWPQRILRKTFAWTRVAKWTPKIRWTRWWRSPYCLGLKTGEKNFQVEENGPKARLVTQLDVWHRHVWEYQKIKLSWMKFIQPRKKRVV